MSDAPTGGPPKTRNSSASITSRSSTALPKTEVIINIYDLLPPGRLSSVLWTIGSSLLHSGVVINGKEYAYGGHNHRSVTGVYWTKPRFEPPGGTFRAEILHGFTLRTDAEVNATIMEVSDRFLGPSYNLLTNNCNHFTSALCEALTSQPAPAWLNRAASVGLALPCMVPKEWISPPDADTADGELLDEAEAEGDDDDVDDDEDDDDEDDEEANELAGMLDSERRRSKAEAQRRRPEFSAEDDADGSPSREGQDAENRRKVLPTGDSRLPPRTSLKDSAGRELPVAERAPILKKT